MTMGGEDFSYFLQEKPGYVLASFLWSAKHYGMVVDMQPLCIWMSRGGRDVQLPSDALPTCAGAGLLSLGGAVHQCV